MELCDLGLYATETLRVQICDALWYYFDAKATGNFYKVHNQISAAFTGVGLIIEHVLLKPEFNGWKQGWDVVSFGEHIQGRLGQHC